MGVLCRDVDYGWLRIPAVLFFYSFMTIVFLIIVNFFLAIVVDAYSEVKSENKENVDSRLVVLASACDFEFCRKTWISLDLFA